MQLSLPHSPASTCQDRYVFLQDMETRLFYGTDGSWVTERSHAMVLASFAAAYDFSKAQKLKHLQAVITFGADLRQLVLPLR